VSSVVNCPRGAGFWAQQCAQRSNGATITRDQLAAIASAVDARATSFTWADATRGFCDVIDPARPMDPRKQALRQFAAFLANMCAGELGIRTLDGGAVSLDPGTEVTVGGSQTTLGDLAHSIDAHLVALQSVSIDGPGVRDDYGRIADLLGGFDDGIGISVSCGTSGSPALSAQLLTAQPNPFRATTTIGYTVATTGPPRSACTT
jgi:hypothetical protein